MLELAEIFRRYGPAYRAKFADRVLPSHLAAMAAIERVPYGGPWRASLPVCNVRRTGVQLSFV